MIPCPGPLFLLPRGTVRVTRRRTSPGGKPFTRGGGAVPPNWLACSGCQGGPSSCVPAVQVLGACLTTGFRHSEFLSTLQERGVCRTQNLQETLRVVAVSWWGGRQHSSGSRKLAFICPLTPEAGIGCGLGKWISRTIRLKVRFRQLFSQGDRVQNQPG